jgi:hypothetical protein
MRRRALVALPLLAACAEMKRPPPPPRISFGDGRADPVRVAINAMAPAFADRGRGLAGKPIEAAEASAQLEFVTNALARDQRYAPMPESLRQNLLLARNEVRDALGIAPDLSPDAAMAGLLSAAYSLRANDAVAAAEALPSPGFRPGGARSVERLGDIGPLPQAAIASALAMQEMGRLDDPVDLTSPRPPVSDGPAMITRGISENQSLGY